MTSTNDYDIGELTAASIAQGGRAPNGSADQGHSSKRERILPTTPLGDRSLGELVATLSRDVALLVHQEIELIKADLLATSLKLAVGALGFVVALAGLLFAVPILSIAAALGVHALGVSLGFSFLIVGGAYLLIALVAAGFGMATLRKTKAPNRAVGSVKADLHAIARKPKPIPPTT